MAALRVIVSSQVATLPRRTSKASPCRQGQGGVDRGELEHDTDFAFADDLLIGPLFMLAVVWGQPLSREAAEQTVDAVLATFGTDAGRG